MADKKIEPKRPDEEPAAGARKAETRETARKAARKASRKASRKAARKAR